MKKVLYLATALLAVPVLGGCVSMDEYDRVVSHLETEQEANDALAAENARLEGLVRRSKTDNEALQKAIEEMKAANAEVKVDEAGLYKKLEELWGLEKDSDWEVVQSGGAVGVRIDDRGVLFNSGSWMLTSQTKTILRKLAATIEKKLDAGTYIRVDGHTDIDPVRKLKAKGIQDNVHLSTMRAMAVRDFLVSTGLPKDRIFVAGFGEHWPIAAGKTSKAKQRNRRVEIYLGSSDALSINGVPGASVSK